MLSRARVGPAPRANERHSDNLTGLHASAVHGPVELHSQVKKVPQNIHSDNYDLCFGGQFQYYSDAMQLRQPVALGVLFCYPGLLSRPLGAQPSIGLEDQNTADLVDFNRTSVDAVHCVGSDDADAADRLLR